ncbi:MAG: hypothetical protein KBG72_02915 [Agrobacterium sp.]|jgi:hypothetical protein|nr:hypothetical protein [Agrobacterium sp.]HRM73484.1 hypothetical protein [Paracoccus sp. (in: a-proteobacteria)]
MSNLTDAFAKADKTRRTQRDDKRQSFFADLGLNVFHDPFELNLDPAAQLSVALHLLDLAKETHQDETSAIRALKAELSGMQLGLPTLPTTSRDRPSLTHLYRGAWAKGYFSR